MSDEIDFSEDLLIGLTPEQREAVTSDARRLLVRATAARGSANLLYPMKTALARLATLGEVADVLREEFGEYRAQ